MRLASFLQYDQRTCGAALDAPEDGCDKSRREAGRSCRPRRDEPRPQITEVKYNTDEASVMIEKILNSAGGMDEIDPQTSLSLA